jgi:hypothetical protein
VDAPRLLERFRLRSSGGRQGASSSSAHARGGANAGREVLGISRRSRKVVAAALGLRVRGWTPTRTLTQYK